LTLLAAVESRRERHLAAARWAARDGRYDDALEELTQAAALRDGPDIRPTRACAFLLAGHFPGALAEYSQLTRS